MKKLPRDRRLVERGGITNAATNLLPTFNGGINGISLPLKKVAG